MSNVHELHKSSVKEALEHVLAAEDRIQAVMIVTLNKDGTQFFSGSKMSHYERCFLKCFIDACIFGWFNQGNEHGQG